MPEFHSEPFLHLAGLTHKAALIAWGAFYFKVKGSDGSFKLVDDGDLDHVHPPRHQTIGARSEPYGKAVVEVFDSSNKVVASASTVTENYCWVPGLQPDTEYSYRVIVNDEEWAEGERRDWVAGDKMGLKKIGSRYKNVFRTHPDPTKPAAEPLTFAVIGDFGTGIKKEGRAQARVASTLFRAVEDKNVRLILTTGDNIYAGKKLFGLLAAGATGDEDDDWYFTFYQPYRYIINRIPVYPSLGNHDASESEERDDRAQLVDNLYIDQRIAGEEAAGRASVDPGLFYRFRYGSEIEFLCIDTSKEPDVFKGGRLFQHPKHAEFLKLALPDKAAGEPNAPAWQIPFSHHPPFCAGPQHHNTEGMEELVQRFQRAGVRIVFSGHEHQFQHSQFESIDYFVTGAGGKLRTSKPDEFQEAHTTSWSAQNHFLLVTVNGNKATVKPIGGIEGGELTEIQRLDRKEKDVSDPIIVSLMV